MEPRIIRIMRIDTEMERRIMRIMRIDSEIEPRIIRIDLGIEDTRGSDGIQGQILDF